MAVSLRQCAVARDVIKEFLRSHGISEVDIEKIWLAIALLMTPGISTYLHPIAAITAEGVMMDLLGLGYDEFTDAQREDVTKEAFPARLK